MPGKPLNISISDDFTDDYDFIKKFIKTYLDMNPSEYPKLSSFVASLLPQYILNLKPNDINSLWVTNTNVQNMLHPSASPHGISPLPAARQRLTPHHERVNPRIYIIALIVLSVNFTLCVTAVLRLASLGYEIPDFVANICWFLGGAIGWILSPFFRKS